MKIDKQTNDLIRSNIEERVAARNRINAARIAAGDAIPADEIFVHGSIVSLFIPKPLRLTSELRRVYTRIVQHTRAGYQLNTKWRLITGRQ